LCFESSHSVHHIRKEHIRIQRKVKEQNRETGSGISKDGNTLYLSIETSTKKLKCWSRNYKGIFKYAYLNVNFSKEDASDNTINMMKSKKCGSVCQFCSVNN
jgi:hypothetical protein